MIYKCQIVSFFFQDCPHPPHGLKRNTGRMCFFNFFFFRFHKNLYFDIQNHKNTIAPNSVPVLIVNII